MPASPSLSVIIPVRNEKGTLEAARQRLSGWDRGTLEVIFVESGSTDGSAEELQRLARLYAGQMHLHIHRIEQRGKARAVHHGLMQAHGELVTILDADLTVPPEDLGAFYDAYCSGKGDFINGSRFIYPMEKSAMRPLNALANRFFAKLLSAVLKTKLTDTLCGTKLLRREDWLLILKLKKEFPAHDPFGDFDLLFGAAALGLKIAEVPVHYKARVYGSTNILRFRHGLMLIAFVAQGARYLRKRRGVSTE